MEHLHTLIIPHFEGCRGHMKAIQLYHDLVTDIEMYEIRIRELERELMWIQRMEGPRNKLVAKYSDEPVTHFPHIPLDRLYNERIKKIHDEIYKLHQLLKEMRQTKAEMESKMRNLRSLKGKVAYMRFVEGKTLKQIAREMGYSYDRIKQVSMKLSAEMKKAPAS